MYIKSRLLSALIRLSLNELCSRIRKYIVSYNVYMHVRYLILEMANRAQAFSGLLSLGVYVYNQNGDC